MGDGEGRGAPSGGSGSNSHRHTSSADLEKWRDEIKQHAAVQGFKGATLSSLPYGVGGALLGGSWAVLQGTSVAHYSSSLGASYFLLGVVFHGTEGALRYSAGMEESSWKSYGASGFFTGGTCGLAFGGRGTAARGAPTFAILGVALYYAGVEWKEKKQKWRKDRIDELAGLKPPKVMFGDWRKVDDAIPEGFQRWMKGSFIENSKQQSSPRKPGADSSPSVGGMSAAKICDPSGKDEIR